MSKLDAYSLGFDPSILEAAKKVKEGVFQPTLYDLPSEPSSNGKVNSAGEDIDKAIKKAKKEDVTMTPMPGYNKTIRTP